MKSSPIQKTRSRGHRAPSIVTNAQLSLLYQLEQRKVAKLENENRALRERINNLLSKEDEERIELLVADKTRRKLVQLKAITERTIKSLDSGLHEFQAFVNDIEDAIGEQERNNAIRPLNLDNLEMKVERERILRNFSPKLKRIPESPMMPSTSKSSVILSKTSKGLEEEEDELEVAGENETVDETPILEEMEEASGIDKENTIGGDQRVQQTKEEAEESATEVERGASPIAIENETVAETPGQCRTVTIRARSNVANKAQKKESKIALSESATDRRMSSMYEHGQHFSHTPINSTPMNSSSLSNSRSRRAVVAKVGSYKEPSLHKKMRREH